jgi:hypothetical protein
MGAIEDRVGLRPWSVATFRAVSFVIAVALSVHSRGALAGALSNLNTAIGFALFSVLWTTTFIATRIGDRYYRRRVEDARYSASRVEATIVAGGWNGVFIYLGPTLALIFALVDNVPALVIASVFGTIIAFVVGAFVGLAYGIVETLLRSISDALIGVNRDAVIE